MSEALLKVENLRQYFPLSRGHVVKAVNGVSFEIYPGETYGLVGESGSGKTTIGRSVIRLYDPTDGTITFNGKEISGKLDRDTRTMLRENMQMIYQDPMSSLNPRKRWLTSSARAWTSTAAAPPGRSGLPSSARY